MYGFIRITFLALLFVTPLMFGAVYSWGIGILEITILTLSGLWLWYFHKKNKSFSWRQYWGLIPLLVFLAVIMLQLIPWPAFLLKSMASENLAAWNRLHTLKLSSGEHFPISLNPFASAYEGLKFLCYFLALWLTINFINHGKKKKGLDCVFTLALVITLTGALISAIAIVQAGLGAKLIYGFWQPYHSHAFMGPYVNRNHFAGYLEMALPMGMGILGSLVFLRQHQWQKSGENLSDKQLALIFLVSLFVLLMFIGLLLSLSRGGIISGSIVLAAQFTILLALLSRRRALRRFLTLGLVLVSIVTTTACLIPWEKIGARLSTLPTESITMDVRFRVSMDTWNMSKNFPLFGSGMGSYERVFPRYKTWPRQGLFQHAHNDYLEFLAETGWVGFLAFLIFFIWVVAKGLKYIGMVLKLVDRCSGPVISRAFIVSGALGGVLTILLHSVVDFNLHIPANAFLFFTLCGITVSLSEFNIQNNIRLSTEEGL